MKSIVVIGNCQIGPIKNALNSCETFRQEFSIQKIPPVHLIKNTEIDTYAQLALNADVVLTQPIVDQNRFGALCTETLRANFSPTKNLWVFPSLYFDGYFPTFNSLPWLKGPAGQLHDFAVVHAYLRGLADEEIVTLVSSGDWLSADLAKERYELSIKQMKEREINFRTSVSFSDHLREFAGRSKLMHQFNHPTAGVVEWLVNQLLTLLGISEPARYGKEELADNQCNVHPVVARALLEFEAKTDSIVCLGSELSSQHFIERSLACYREADRARLANECVNKFAWIGNKSSLGPVT